MKLLQTQRHVINLDPSLECVNCALKLERQALEWGKAYRFRSCADVSIVRQEVRVIILPVVCLIRITMFCVV